MNKLIKKWKDGTLQQILRELRWISGYGRRYLWAIGWYILLGALGTVLGLVAGVISKDIIDIVTGHQTGYAVWAAAAFVTVQLVKILLGAVTGRISAKVQLRVSQELRAEIFQNILRAQWEPLSQYHSGDLLARSSRDADTVAASVLGWVPSLLINLLQFTGTFLVLVYFDYTLALLALASAPVTLALSFFLTRRIRRHSEQMRAIGSEMTAFHAETFQNIQFIKSLDALGIFREKLTRLQCKQRQASLEYNRFSIMTNTFLSLIGMMVGGVCFFWSVYRLWGNHITFGEMTLFLQLSGSLSGTFGALVALIPSAITAATAAGRIMAVTQLPPEAPAQQDAVCHMLHTGENTVHLQAEGVDFSYASGKTVFRQAAFFASPGEIVAFVGPSGGGKTTMLRLLLGVVTPERGSIRFSGGAPAITLSASAATRGLFAYVPQENPLFSGTVAENLRLVNPQASDGDLISALKTACAYEFVSKLPQGLDTQIGEQGSGLSEGQRQRLSIARALLSEAPVLLLDEATSALDVQTERVLLRNIMQHRKGRTCIITTHRPSVLELCDRVYRIDDQKVAPVEESEIRQMIMDF